MNEYLNFVEYKFQKCFADKVYIQEKPKLITLQIDKTLDFVGSKISPLKHYTFENSIPGK